MKNTDLKVLMYHGISGSSPVPRDREVGAELYDVSKEDFRSQMEWLRKQGYSTDVNTVGKQVIITFDDGEMNNYHEALPILKEFGFKASFFVIVKRIGNHGYMGWKELKELIKEGMTVGSHGLSHHILTNLLETQVDEELRGSKRTLEFNLKIVINEVSIPRGFCNDKIINMAHELGYKQVYISDKSRNVRSECIPRMAVKRNWSLKRFQQKMNGGILLSEIFSNLFKGISKSLLKESGYNWVRGVILKMVL